MEAIQIAALNGARYLGRERPIGTVAVGKNADIAVVRGDPARHIVDVENIEMVLKDGVVYDRQELLAAVKGEYGEY